MKKFLIYIISVVALLPTAAETQSENTTVPMAHAARAFLNSLRPEQATNAHLPFASEERENWNFVPANRKGTPLRELDGAQCMLVENLLATGFSAETLAKIHKIISYENILRSQGNEPHLRDAGLYFTTVFGDPAPEGTWAWRFEGHHIAANFTIVKGKLVSATPLFLGVNPAEVKDGPAQGTRVLVQEEDLARSLAVSLHARNQPVVVSQDPKTISIAAQRVANWPEITGVSIREMNGAEVKLLDQLIDLYHLRFACSLAKPAPDCQECIHFSWVGSLKPNERFAYRIQSETYVIEFMIHPDGNHIHSVVRSSDNDFGRAALSKK